ncbi:MAG: ATP-binding protein, partial [Methanosarcinales archaeon]|nr:ATP-binding protein [Methanosarcinales archaeon]
ERSKRSERPETSEMQEISWHDANQRFLSAALAIVRYDLERHIVPSKNPEDIDKQIKTAQQTIQELNEKMHAPSALETLCATFGISSFECNVLLLCAGIELDSNFLSLCANAHGDPNKTYPTFSLALAALPDPNWGALTPAGPLRHWRLIEVETGNTLTHSPIHIDERILHYLTGLSYMDQRLEGIIEHLPFLEDDHDLVPSHQEQAEQIMMVWDHASGKTSIPAIQLCGIESASKRAIALKACASLRMNLYAMSGQFIPTTPNELEALIRLWEREVALGRSVLLLDCDEMDRSDPIRESAINKFIQGMDGPLVINTSSRHQIWQRQVFTLEIQKPTAREQEDVWKRVLGTECLDLNVEGLVSQFNLSPQGIFSICNQVLERISLDDGHQDVVGDDLSEMIWDACRMQARSHMDSLAQRIEPVATWDDLILPSMQKQMVHEVAVHVKQRLKVYNNWGFAAKSSQGLGISALFAGSSGTGKTMAAEVLANELRLDLYRIDLSQVVSKYIGETEKN